MKGSYSSIERKGLPGGPNEQFTYITGVFSSDVFSTEGYKRNSPDKNNPFNIIPSGNITMEGVDFPVMGMDNLGNTKAMMPGSDYKFPGDMVFETPMYKRGGGLLTKTMKCNSCGWSWKAADGGNDVTTCHKCGGEALPKAQGGGSKNKEPIIPTAADSLALYNSAIAKDAFYQHNPEYSLWSSSTRNKDIPVLIEKHQNKYDQYNQEAANRYEETGSFGSLDPRFTRQGNIYSFGDILYGSPNPIYNPAAPPILLHPSIEPQYWVRYTGSEDISDVPIYDLKKIWPKSLGPIGSVTEIPKRTTPDPNRSVADNLKLMGEDTSFTNRKKLFLDAGLGDTYTGTAEQNVLLNKWLRDGRPTNDATSTNTNNEQTTQESIVDGPSDDVSVKELKKPVETIKQKPGAWYRDEAGNLKQWWPEKQNGGSIMPIIVPPGDPRAQAYADSLTLYNQGRRDANTIGSLLKDKGYLTWDEYHKTGSGISTSRFVPGFSDAWLRIMELNQENPHFGRGTRTIEYPVADIASTNRYDFHLYAKPVQPVIVDPDKFDYVVGGNYILSDGTVTKGFNEWKPKRAIPDPNRSVVDNLKIMGQDTSFSNRKKLAEQAGIPDYKGTAEQNAALNKWLHEGKLNPSTENKTLTNEQQPAQETSTPLQDSDKKATKEGSAEAIKEPNTHSDEGEGTSWYWGYDSEWIPDDSYPGGGYQKRIKRKIPIEGSAPQYQTGGGTVKGRAATSTRPNQKKQLTTTPKSEKPLTTNEDQILTYKDNADWFDSRAVYHDNPQYDNLIRKRVYSGKYGYNPATGAVVPLKKEDQVEISDEIKNILALNQEKEDEWYRVRAMSPEDQEAYRRKKWAAALRAAGKQPIKIDEIGGRSNPLLREQDKTGSRPWEGKAGQTLFLTPEEIEAYYKDWVAKSMVAVGENPLFYAPGIIAGGSALPALGEVAFAGAAPYFSAPITVAGTTIPAATAGNLINAGFAGHGLYNVGPDAIDFATNPSWEGAGNLAMDALEIAPIARAARQSMGELGSYLAKQTPLKNAYKYIPGTVKEAPLVPMYRTQKPGQTQEVVELLDLQKKANEVGISNLSTAEKIKLSQFQTRPNIGQGFDTELSKASYYGNPNIRKTRGYDETPEVLRTVVPREQAELFNVKNFPEYAKQSAATRTEHILPMDIVQQAEKFSFDDLARLRKEESLLNPEPHWLKGYPAVDVPKQLPGSPNAPTSWFRSYLTTQTPLKNTWQYNPFALKEIPIKPGHSYRAVEGPYAYADYLQTGAVRSPYYNKEVKKILDAKWAAENPNSAFNLNRQGTTSLPSFSKEKILRKYGDDAGHIFETNLPVKKSKSKHGVADFPYDKTTGEFIKEVPKENITAVYPFKPHWLKGYKPVDVPKQLPGSPNTPTSWFNGKRQNALLVEQARRSGEAPLPDYMTPYISRRYTPATKQQEIFESFLLPEQQEKLRELRTQRFTREGPVPSNAASSIDNVTKAGIDGNFITRPLTPFTKNELTPGKYLYRKIGGRKGLEDLINKQGAQAPAPLRMNSGQRIDTPFFGVGKSPNEDYSGIFAVETSLPSKSKYDWSSHVGGTSNYGVAPIDKNTGELIKNIPLDDLEVFRKKWFSNNYRKLDKSKLQEELKSASLQELSEKLYKWGIRGYLADQILNDGDLTGGKAVEIIEENLERWLDQNQTGGEIIPEDVKNMKAALDKELKAVKNYNLTPAKKNKLIQELYTIYNESVPPKFQLGGPVLSAELQMYKDYITGKDESPEAVKNYDKLNRVHYKKAKANNTSPANYIMTELIS